MENDLGIARARHGYLGHWAEQGVLLLNNCLTVEAGQAASHQRTGWERFPPAVIAAVTADPAPKALTSWDRPAPPNDATSPTIRPRAHPPPQHPPAPPPPPPP